MSLRFREWLGVKTDGDTQTADAFFMGKQVESCPFWPNIGFSDFKVIGYIWSEMII